MGLGRALWVGLLVGGALVAGVPACGRTVKSGDRGGGGHLSVAPEGGAAGETGSAPEGGAAGETGAARPAAGAAGETSPAGAAGQPQQGGAGGGPASDAFVVSDHFTPSALLRDASEPGSVVVRVNEQCKERPPGARGACYRFDYAQRGSWYQAQLFWSYPAGNFGESPGLAVDDWPFTRIVFSAAVLEGTERVTFFIGAQNPVLQYADAFTETKSTRLTSDWQRISIDIPRYPGEVTNLIAALGWLMDFGVGPEARAKTLFVDDIVYE